MVNLPSREGYFAYRMKNYEPFLLAPEFAMDKTPRFSCLKPSHISSVKNLFSVGYIDWPPLPVPEGSPPYRIKPLMFR